MPLNDSISMTLDGVQTTTTVEFSNQYQKDAVFIGDSIAPINEVTGSKKERVAKQLDRLRQIKGINLPAKVVSKNNFPTGAGIASSASAFSALTAACIYALDLKVDSKEQSILNRLAGSGSAARSVPGGFVIWHASSKSKESYAEQLYPEDYWDLADVILVVSNQEKKHSSLVGHSLADTSPFFAVRKKTAQSNNKQLMVALAEKDLAKLGEVIEKEMFILHSLAMTSTPSLLYWSPETVGVLDHVNQLREDGLQVYATLDAGPNVHLISAESSAQKLINYFKELEIASQIYHCRVGGGVRQLEEHLF